MTVELHWHDPEKTILIHHYFNHVDLEDYLHAVNAASVMLAEVRHPVDLILDIAEARIDWKDLIAGASYANPRVPENQRFMVMVGAKPFVRAMTGIAKRVAPKANSNLYFANTLDEAQKLIFSKRV